MTVLRPRNRLVNFRVTEEEFTQLKDACRLSSARSVSDFARGAVLEWVSEAFARTERGTESGAGNRLAGLSGAVTDLEHRVTQLVRLLSSVEKESQHETEQHHTEKVSR